MFSCELFLSLYAVAYDSFTLAVFFRQAQLKTLLHAPQKLQ